MSSLSHGSHLVYGTAADAASWIRQDNRAIEIFMVQSGPRRDVHGSKSEVKRHESPEATDKCVAKNEDAAKAEGAV